MAFRLVYQQVQYKPRSGYLDLNIGNFVFLQYVGSSDDEKGWSYGRTSDGRSGWFASYALEPEESSVAREAARPHFPPPSRSVPGSTHEGKSDSKDSTRLSPGVHPARSGYLLAPVAMESPSANSSQPHIKRKAVHIFTFGIENMDSKLKTGCQPSRKRWD